MATPIEAEYERFYRHHAQGVRSYLTRLLGPFLAEDATQLMFLQAYLKWQDLPSSAIAQAVWLRRTARFKALRLLEDRDRQRTPKAASLNALPCAAPSGEQLAARIAERDWAIEVLESLPPPDRELLWQLCVEGRERAAVAREMGVSPGGLRVRLHRVRRRLEREAGEA